METHKTTKNRYKLCLFLFNINVDLKNNNVKNILHFLGARVAAINLFQSILINHKITYDTVVKRHLRPHCRPFDNCLLLKSPVLWCPCFDYIVTTPIAARFVGVPEHFVRF